MVHAFVLLSAAPGTAEDLASAVREIDAVSEAHVVAGDYDVVAEVDDEEVFEVLSTVTREIRTVDGVEETRTYVSLE